MVHLGLLGTPAPGRATNTIHMMSAHNFLAYSFALLSFIASSFFLMIDHQRGLDMSACNSGKRLCQQSARLLAIDRSGKKVALSKFTFQRSQFG